MVEATPTTPFLNAHSVWLAGLDEQAVNEVLGSATTKQMPSNKALFASGDPAAHLFLLRQGRVRYFKPTKSGEEILLTWVTCGDVFGLGTLLKHPPGYMGSAETISDCELFVWDHLTARKMATLHPQLAENSLRIVLRYLKQYTERHVGIVTKTAEQRLAQVVLDLAERTGKTTSTGVQIDATNEQLSSLADISPFTASRVLNGWGQKGFVSKKRQRVFVHTPEALAGD
jgi:CRP/FNR family transcriptional regulator, nitrogen oxide reductase regulator